MDSQCVIPRRVIDWLEYLIYPHVVLGAVKVTSYFRAIYCRATQARLAEVKGI